MLCSRSLAILATILGTTLLGQNSAWSQQALPIPSIGLRDYSNSCKQKVLERMGWQLKENSGVETDVSFPDLCQNASQEDLKTQLQIQFQTPIDKTDPSELSRYFDIALRSPGTQCFFANAYAQALGRATRSLKSNHLYFFSPFWIQDNIRLGSLKKTWQKAPCAGAHCYTPATGPSSEAIDSLYQELFSSDCGVGLQLAEYAAVKQLFGSSAFEKVFRSDEIFVGNWEDINHSNSFTHGLESKRIASGDGRLYGQSGFRNLIGVTGIIGSERDESFLDDKVNRNENFIITGTSAEASASLVKNGGLAYYQKLTQDIWLLTQDLRSEELQVLENFVLLGRLKKVTPLLVQSALPPESGLVANDKVKEVARLLSDPFLADTQVYVHPVGQKTFAWHFLRLARLNRRMPYAIHFYSDALHYGIYERWLKYQLDSCTQEPTQ